MVVEGALGSNGAVADPADREAHTVALRELSDAVKLDENFWSASSCRSVTVYLHRHQAQLLSHLATRPPRLGRWSSQAGGWLTLSSRSRHHSGHQRSRALDDQAQQRVTLRIRWLHR